VEDRLGRENLYRLLCAGKVMREEELLSDHAGVAGGRPVVVMVTRPGEAGKGGNRVRTDSEDSGFGDGDEEEEAEHFVTDREFTIALEVVMDCQHFRRAAEPVTRPEMARLVKELLPEEKGPREAILGRLEQVERAAPSREQFRAFVLDIQSMWQEDRPLASIVEEEEDDDEEEDGREEDASLAERSLARLEGMGFQRGEAEAALERSGGSLQVALDLLLPRGSGTPPPLPDIHNPLSFLRDLPEFQFLRVLVLQQPALLQPLLVSFGQSHPEVMEVINQHKQQFVAMLYEQTGGTTDRHRRH
jgi:hypothetical protein